MTMSTKVISTKIVCIYPYTRGFGYAVMENPLKIIEIKLFDLKEFDVQKMTRLVQEIIRIHKPITLILEDTNSKYCRKGARTKQFIHNIAAWSRKNEIAMEFYSREDIREVFKRWNAFNKYEIAEVLCRNIEQLKSLSMEKPKYPGREPNIEALFSAVSMGVTHYFLKNL